MLIVDGGGGFEERGRGDDAVGVPLFHAAV